MLSHRQHQHHPQSNCHGPPNFRQRHQYCEGEGGEGVGGDEGAGPQEGVEERQHEGEVGTHLGAQVMLVVMVMMMMLMELKRGRWTRSGGSPWCTGHVGW